ncbi:hypothetical protein BDF21DRAFT_390645 [Thamnidium elegans]|nr:hypothetical protein BDF21DRAFT_390645 [Thamnidium elegans]
MLYLKFNKDISKQELNLIEKKFKQYSKETITPEFNVLNLSRTDVYAHVLSIFVRVNVHGILKVSVSQLLDFLIDVAEKYTEAPYHTFYHAADIVTMLYYLCHDLSANKYLTDLDITFLMVAALCHDMGHPGYNNTFQINTKTDLALRYGDGSILESYSVDLTIELIKKHKLDKKHKEMNEILTDLIISTDMAYHPKLQEEANQLFNTWSKLTTTNKNDFPSGDRLSLSRILLHTADISNTARPWTISKQWSDLIVKEIYNQGDEEKKRKLTISAGMDREVCSQKSITLKFADIILPFFESLVSLLPKSHVLVDFLASNRIQWECLELAKKRRVSSDIIIQPSNITFKRIRLGFRSQSYPTVLYHHQSKKIHSSFPIQKPNNLLPLEFKSFIYDTTTTTTTTTSTNLESIVLYHPYDQ